MRSAESLVLEVTSEQGDRVIDRNCSRKWTVEYSAWTGGMDQVTRAGRKPLLRETREKGRQE